MKCRGNGRHRRFTLGYAPQPSAERDWVKGSSHRRFAGRGWRYRHIGKSGADLKGSGIKFFRRTAPACPPPIALFPFLAAIRLHLLLHGLRFAWRQPAEVYAARGAPPLPFCLRTIEVR